MARARTTSTATVWILTACIAATCGATTITINPSVQFQTMTGIGGSDLENATRDQVEESVLDLGCSTYRLFRDFDLYDFEPANDNNDPNTFNWSAFKISSNVNLRTDIQYLRYAKAAGIKHFFYSVLALPRWMKINVPRQDSMAFWCSGQCGGDFDTTKYDEYVECVTAWVKVFKDSVVEFDAIGLQNEPSFYEPYGSCRVNAKVYRELAKRVGCRFEREGIRTKVIVAEEVLSDWMSVRGYATISYGDTAARRYLTAIAVHNYAGDGITATSPSAQVWGALGNLAKGYVTDTWMTETSGFSNDWAGAMRGARVMFGAMKYGRLSLWTWLEVPRKASNPDIFAATKCFTKYIRPGAVHIESSCPDTSLGVITFRDKAQRQLVGVIINPASAAATVTLAGPSVPAQVRLYQSNASNKFVDAGMVQSASFTVLPNSVSTIVGDGYDPAVGVAGPAPISARVSASGGTVGRMHDVRGRCVARTGPINGASVGVYLVRTTAPGTSRVAMH